MFEYRSFCLTRVIVHEWEKKNSHSLEKNSVPNTKYSIEQFKQELFEKVFEFHLMFDSVTAMTDFVIDLYYIISYYSLYKTCKYAKFKVLSNCNIVFEISDFKNHHGICFMTTFEFAIIFENKLLKKLIIICINTILYSWVPIKNLEQF